MASSVQLQLRRNAEDLQEFLKDMGNWEKEAKEKDQVLRTQKESSGKAHRQIRRTKKAVISIFSRFFLR